MATRAMTMPAANQAPAAGKTAILGCVPMFMSRSIAASPMADCNECDRACDLFIGLTPESISCSAVILCERVKARASTGDRMQRSDRRRRPRGVALRSGPVACPPRANYRSLLHRDHRETMRPVEQREFAETSPRPSTASVASRPSSVTRYTTHVSRLQEIDRVSKIALVKDHVIGG